MEGKSLVFDNLEETIQKLYKYCLKLSRSSWGAEDLVQETMMKAYKLSKENPDRTLTYSFLYKMAKNLFIDGQRKYKKEQLSCDNVEGSVEDFADYDSLIEILLMTLPLKQAMLITLKDVFGYSTKEMAAMLRVSNESIKTTLHRSRRILQSSPPSEQASDIPHPTILQGISTAIKKQNPQQLFLYYRLLEARNYKVLRSSNAKGFHVVDPSGNVLEVR
ncbi:RNA polymerase sigma factor [Bacillus tianshenii]|uniref:RNA polymerase sigma factor n=1 Tax=Sutcliffiella tianshenii TaxID=1463404 RepID=UPI0030B84E96